MLYVIVAPIIAWILGGLVGLALLLAGFVTWTVFSRFGGGVVSIALLVIMPLVYLFFANP